MFVIVNLTSIDMIDNKNLGKAKDAKKDEFYTQLDDITTEGKHYKQYFKDKVVFCNCDDPYESNFFKYYALMFNDLGLKKLICTCWNGSPITQTQLRLFDEPKTDDGRSHIAYKLVLTELSDLNGDGAEDLEDVKIFLQKHKPTILKGNGDFRSQECVELLKEADIIVTNPPFSLFREFVALLMKYNKQFLIIGNVNAITYKEIFPLIKENKVWLGPSITSGDRKFHVPDDYELKAAGCGIDENGKKFIRVKGVRWFTNLDHNKRHEPLDLYKHYTPEEYPKYDNYDAINVDKTFEIPMDYDGVMGVPLTFLDKYCPEQFEILGITDRQNTSGLRTKKYTKEDDKRYNDLNARGVLKTKKGYKSIYARLLIRKKP